MADEQRPLRFYGRDSAPPPLEPFLERARQSIVFVGFTLETLPQYEEILRRKLAESASITFVTIYPDAEEARAKSLYDYLRERMGDLVLQQAQKHLMKSVGLFKTLRQQYPARVRVRGCFEVPRYGLASTDVGDGSQMRVTIYPSAGRSNYLDGVHSYLDINPNSDEGEAAYAAFREYYVELYARSEEIPDDISTDVTRAG